MGPRIKKETSRKERKRAYIYSNLQEIICTFSKSSVVSSCLILYPLILLFFSLLVVFLSLSYFTHLFFLFVSTAQPQQTYATLCSSVVLFSTFQPHILSLFFILFVLVCRVLHRLNTRSSFFFLFFSSNFSMLFSSVSRLNLSSAPPPPPSMHSPPSLSLCFPLPILLPCCTPPLNPPAPLSRRTGQATVYFCVCFSTFLLCISSLYFESRIRQSVSCAYISYVHFHKC